MKNVMKKILKPLIIFFVALITTLFVILPLFELKYYEYKYIGLERSHSSENFERNVSIHTKRTVCFAKRGESNFRKRVFYCDYNLGQDLLDYHNIIGGYGFAIMCRYDKNLVSSFYIKRLHPDFSF